MPLVHTPPPPRRRIQASVETLTDEVQAVRLNQPTAGVRPAPPPRRMPTPAVTAESQQTGMPTTSVFPPIGPGNPPAQALGRFGDNDLRRLHEQIQQHTGQGDASDDAVQGGSNSEFTGFDPQSAAPSPVKPVREITNNSGGGNYIPPPRPRERNSEHRWPQQRDAAPPPLPAQPQPAAMEQPSDELPFRVREPLAKNMGSFSERIILPSGNLFYNFDSITIRPFEITDLARLARAIKRKDIVMINDVLDCVVDVDLRDLWMGDYRYIMYWLRINSLTKIPYTLNWTSFYGNRNTTQVTQTDLQFSMLTDSLSPEQWQHYQALGLTYPNVRDSEEWITTQVKLSEDDRWIYERAQYVDGIDIFDKIRRLSDPRRHCLNALSDIKEFSELLGKGGVKEFVKVQDRHFNADAAFDRLMLELKDIETLLETDLEMTAEQEDVMTTRLELLRQETERLSTGEAEPMLETIPMRISVFAFFPGI